MYLYTCAFVHKCQFASIYVGIRTNVSVYVQMQTYVFPNVYNECVCTRINVQFYAFLYVCMHVLRLNIMYVCTHTIAHDVCSILRSMYISSQIYL